MKKCWYLLCLSLIFVQCGNNNNDDDIPLVPVNIYVDLNINTSAPLSFLGGYIYLEGGNKGIILLHNFDDSFIAVERTCSYHPYDSCNIITMDSSGIIYKCGKYKSSSFEACCGSQFSLEGYVNKGPATRPLRTYTTSKSGNQIHIFN